MRKKIQAFRTKNVSDGYSAAEGVPCMISELIVSSQLPILSKNLKNKSKPPDPHYFCKTNTGDLVRVLVAQKKNHFIKKPV